MGEIMKIRCRTCQKEWQCVTGCGLQHGKKENIIDAFQTDEQAKVAMWMEKSRIPLYDFRYQIAVCGFCNSLISVPVLRGIDDDGIFIGSCPSCGNQVRLPLSETVSDITCPSCQHHTLTSEEIGYWD